MRDLKHEIIHFWFEETAPQQWFQKSPDFDALVRERFGAAYERMRENPDETWAGNAEGALALCIILDQFPRHMFRDTPEAFSTDALALSIVKQALTKGFDQVLEPVKRGFLYLPFQHSEDLAEQERSLKLYTAMKDENPAGYIYAVRHHDAILRFGRFPHRNVVLGRENKPGEAEFLKEKDGFL
ncbi:MAG: DUF924 domain-containing protein [Alphaproteobacteria bacterium]|nr:DUF924 domain-containing protein [Alphaproteobacteria bacterium]